MSLYRREARLSRAKAAVLSGGLLFFAGLCAYQLLWHWGWMDPVSRATTLFGLGLFGSFTALSLPLLFVRRPLLVVDYGGIEALLGYADVVRLGWETIEAWNVSPEEKTWPLQSWLEQPSINIRLIDEQSVLPRLSWAGRLHAWSNRRSRDAPIAVPASIVAGRLNPLVEVMRQLHPELERKP